MPDTPQSAQRATYTPAYDARSAEVLSRQLHEWSTQWRIPSWWWEDAPLGQEDTRRLLARRFREDMQRKLTIGIRAARNARARGNYPLSDAILVALVALQRRYTEIRRLLENRQPLDVTAMNDAQREMLAALDIAMQSGAELATEAAEALGESAEVLARSAGNAAGSVASGLLGSTGGILLAVGAFLWFRSRKPIR